VTSMVRYADPPSGHFHGDEVAIRARRAREAREEREAHRCAWCGTHLPNMNRATCSHACRSALARYERAKREGREVPLYKGQPMRPAGAR
jgi:predicted nucleic acid-binding Zn ribbon protein